MASQPGQLFVVQNGSLVATPALDLSAVMCTETERGLLGVAVDPQFASNGFIYVYYTFKKSASCPRNAPGYPVNRVSRFKMTGNTAARTSESVLIDNIPNYNANHNGGDLHFGRDGYLYVASGDGGCDYTGATGCAALNGAARYPYWLVGKVLRVTSTGGIPPANPFQGPNSVRCNVSGRARPGQQCREVFALGLRNPLRLAFDPNAAGTRLFINDVGQNTWEEVDEGSVRADYGWNMREGNCATGSVTGCGAAPLGMTNPIYSYRHVTGGCQAITGGAFVPSGVWPAEFNGAYLFADYTCGSIFKLTNSPGTGTVLPNHVRVGRRREQRRQPHVRTARRHAGAVQPHVLNGGQVRRIAAIPGTNRTPTAYRGGVSAVRSDAAGAIELDASGSSDPDGDVLAYNWDFGDGSLHVATAAANHTYSAAGHFVATVVVDDRHGHTSAAWVDRRGEYTAVTLNGVAVRLGEIRGRSDDYLSGSAADPEDGSIPASRSHLGSAAASQCAHPPMASADAREQSLRSSALPRGSDGDLDRLPGSRAHGGFIRKAREAA